jgi:hypothetical protein
MVRERPYLIKQRVLARRPYTFPPCEMPLSIYYERFHVTNATSHTFGFYFTTRALSVRFAFTFVHFQSGLKAYRGFSTSCTVIFKIF